VETEEREIQDKTRDGEGSNVVRLPRDWLGPREELVPFGPSAHGAEATEPAEPATSASDFWGERSDALHDAVEGPTPTGGAAGDAAPPPGAKAASTPAPRSRARWPVVAALVVALALVAVLAPRLTTSGPATHSSQARSAGEALLLTAVGRKLGHTRVRLRLELRARPQRPRPRARSTGTSGAPVPASASAAASTTPARSTPASAAPSYVPSSVRVSSSSRAPVSRSSSQPVATSSGSGGGASSGSGAGPTGEGALVGPASCNC
jgi:uncharacterized membrane protein YgcG